MLAKSSTLIPKLTTLPLSGSFVRWTTDQNGRNIQANLLEEASRSKIYLIFLLLRYNGTYRKQTLTLEINSLVLVLLSANYPDISR